MHHQITHDEDIRLVEALNITTIFILRFIKVNQILKIHEDNTVCNVAQLIEAYSKRQIIIQIKDGKDKDVYTLNLN